MQAFFSSLAENQTLLVALGVFSLLTFFGTLLALPFLLVQIPADYFSNNARGSGRWQQQHPLVRWLLVVLKNLLGVLLLLAGIAMLVLPGQGLLTMLMGIVLLDFPGKFQLERAIVSRPAVLRSINWIRRRRGHQDIRL